MRLQSCAWLAVSLLLVASTSPVQAQSNPTAVTALSGVLFSDPDHLALNLDGSPVIAYYELRFLPGQQQCGAAVAPVNLGKPTMDDNGIILAQPIAAFGTITPNCLYTAYLAAIGPGGEGVSSPSDPFVRLIPRLPAGPSRPTVVP